MWCKRILPAHDGRNIIDFPMQHHCLLNWSLPQILHLSDAFRLQLLYTIRIPLFLFSSSYFQDFESRRRPTRTLLEAAKKSPGVSSAIFRPVFPSFPERFSWRSRGRDLSSEEEHRSSQQYRSATKCPSVNLYCSGYILFRSTSQMSGIFTVSYAKHCAFETACSESF